MSSQILAYDPIALAIPVYKSIRRGRQVDELVLPVSVLSFASWALSMI